MTKQNLEWLVQLDPNANVSAWPELAAEDMERGVLCNDKVKRDLWPCPSGFPRRLCKMPDLTVGRDFRIFKRMVNGQTRSKPEDVTFLFTGKYKRPKKGKGTSHAKF